MEMESAARAALMSIDREAAMYRVRTGEELAAAAATLPRFQMTLMASFAGTALLLTLFGLYGTLSYAVARRRREIGVRIALGARRREVFGMVLREAMQLIAAGLIFGLLGARAAERVLANMVFGVPAEGALIAVIACGVMVITGLAAAYAPAKRAASVDPMQALRSE
jgi:ABC-type antimicrobial peptide transport system permease subunit